MEVPAEYDGREHQYIKHQLLESYLQHLFMIVGHRAPEICYIDCFAGPWCDSSEDLSATSIGIALRIMESCKEAFRKPPYNRDIPFRALFIEDDDERYSRLSAFISSRDSGIHVDCFHGDFVDLRNDILKWAGPSAFAFFFIDPCGWKDIGAPTLEPLLKRRKSEFMINFMYDFINRAVPQKDTFHDEMMAFFGCMPNVDGMDPKNREAHLVRLYRNRLKEMSDPIRHIKGTTWTAYARILDRLKQRAKYHLVYYTTHPKGMSVFMEASEKLDLIQKTVHADTRQRLRVESTGQEELFPATEMIEDSTASLDALKEDWLGLICERPQVFGDKEFANILEETDIFPGIHQKALGELISEGRIVNLSAKGKRTSKHVHFDKKEKLKRVD